MNKALYSPLLPIKVNYKDEKERFMFKNYYIKFKKTCIQDNRLDQFTFIDNSYRYSLALQNKLYKLSNVVSSILNSKFESGSPVVNPYILENKEAEYALLFNLNTAVQSLIYNKIMGLEKSKGTANIIRSGIENLAVIQFFSNPENDKYREMFTNQFLLQEYQFAEVYFKEVQGKEIIHKTKYFKEKSVQKYMEFYGFKSKNKAVKAYKQPLGWYRGKQNNSRVSFPKFIKELPNSEVLLKEYIFTSMRIYNYQLGNVISSKVGENYYLEMFMSKIKEMTSHLIRDFKIKETGIIDDYNKLFDPSNGLGYFEYDRLASVFQENYDKYIKLRLTDLKLKESSLTKLAVESYEMFKELYSSFVFGFTDPIRYKFKVLIENTSLLNLLNLNKYMMNKKILEKVSDYRLSEDESEKASIVEKIKNLLFTHTGSMDKLENVLNKNSLGFMISNQNKIPQIAELLRDTDYSYRFTFGKNKIPNNDYNIIVGIFKAYYIEGNFMEHPSVYSLIGYYGKDTTAAKEVLIQAFNVIKNNFILEFNDVVKTMKIEELQEKEPHSRALRLLNEMKRHINTIINIIDGFINVLKFTPSLRYDDYIK